MRRVLRMATEGDTERVCPDINVNRTVRCLNRKILVRGNIPVECPLARNVFGGKLSALKKQGSQEVIRVCAMQKTTPRPKSGDIIVEKLPKSRYCFEMATTISLCEDIISDTERCLLINRSTHLFDC